MDFGGITKKPRGLLPSEQEVRVRNESEQAPWHVALVGHGRAVDVIPIAIGNYWTFLS